MFTIDDRKAREVLIATHARFQNRQNWMSGSYEHGPLGGIEFRRCLMGEIAHQTGGNARDSRSDLYTSIRKWFANILCAERPEYRGSPEKFNDTLGYDAVMKFLEARITQLEQSLRWQSAPLLVTQSPDLALVIQEESKPEDPALHTHWWTMFFKSAPQQACATRRLPERVS